MIASNTLAISGITIRQDSHGRYLLNDLHKAAGGENRHRPKYWAALQQTQELIMVLESENHNNYEGGIPSPYFNDENQQHNYEGGIPVSSFSPLETILGKGKVQGTYVVKELVYAYATWISAKFFLTVIRAYDAMVNKPPYALKDHHNIQYATVYLMLPMVSHVIEMIEKGYKKYGSPRKMIQDWVIKTYSDGNTLSMIPVTRYESICKIFGEYPRCEIPEYVMIESKMLNAYANESAQLKARLAPFLEAERKEIENRISEMSNSLALVSNELYALQA